MQSNCRTASLRILRGILTAALVALLLSATTASAQQSKPMPCGEPATQILKTFTLTNAAQQNDANEILVAVRNLVLPCVKVYLVASQNKIVVQSSPDQIALAEKIIDELDHPRKTYRLTFTVTDFDGATKIGTRHYSLLDSSGQRVAMKQGTKVPVVTGKYDAGTMSAETQNTYLDVGMNFDITVTPYAGGLMMKCKIEQSSVGAETSEIGPHDPIVHQTIIDGVTAVPLGKPFVIGSLDGDAQKRTEISVVAEALT